MACHNTPAAKQRDPAIRPGQEIGNHGALPVTTLEQHGGAAEIQQGQRRAPHIGHVANGFTGQGFRLG
ncbi:hypothetical protein D3C83_83360 [compost metagenome]